jgi:hypothetical protein
MKDATIQITTKHEAEIYTACISSAAIINNTGATIDRIELKAGINIIKIDQYINKNYSIRVANGNNVAVQKI